VSPRLPATSSSTPSTRRYADLRERLGREVPIEIHTVRPATTDEIDMTTWHNEMVVREAKNEG
jgi:hypothetical protein